MTTANLNSSIKENEIGVTCSFNEFITHVEIYDNDTFKFKRKELLLKEGQMN